MQQLMWRTCLKRQVFGALVFASSLNACYSYQPAAIPTAPPPEPVRVYLSEPARRRLWAVASANRPFLDGRVIRTYEDSLLIEVVIPAENMTSFQQRVVLQRNEIVSLQIRHIDRLRTSLAGGLLAGIGTSLAARSLTGKAGGGAYPPKDDGQTEVRIPIIRWRL